ncbi:MAG: pilus assembly protein PilP [Halothiobacillaceae bacterium]
MKPLPKHLLLIVAAASAPLMMTGCTQGKDDLVVFVDETLKKPAAKSIPPIPQLKPYTPITYTAFDARDPFSAPEYVEEKVDNGIRPDSNRSKEPLEAFPLDGIGMMGIIQRNDRPEALVSAPDGTIHTVVVGNYLGQNFGKITNIQETKIDLIEILPDGNGGWMEKPATITMKDQRNQGK